MYLSKFSQVIAPRTLSGALVAGRAASLSQFTSSPASHPYSTSSGQLGRQWLMSMLSVAQQQQAASTSASLSTASSSSKPSGRRGALVLEDGTRFEGTLFGAERSVSGETVFQTGMVGYPESLTDPSYSGQLLCMTYPLVGNYGVPPQERDEHGLLSHFESSRIHAQALVVQDYCEEPSHWRCEQTLHQWMATEGVPGISGVDTRALTKKLRSSGSMLAKLVAEGDDEQQVPLEDPNLRNLIAEVSCTEPRVYNQGGDVRVLLVDCGVKENIVRLLVQQGAEVKVVPYDYDLLSEPHCDGVFLSNGPGDPSMGEATAKNLRAFMDSHQEYSTPIMGICMGNQLLAHAVGASTYKMPFGNRGQNQPCVDTSSGRCFITSQNHGFAVDAATLPAEWRESFVNANDGTNEGLAHRSKPYFSVQFHPEHMGGPTDTEFLFGRFVHACRLHQRERMLASDLLAVSSASQLAAAADTDTDTDTVRQHAYPTVASANTFAPHRHYSVGSAQREMSATAAAPLISSYVAVENSLLPHHLLSLSDLKASEVESLLQRAARLKQQQRAGARAAEPLAGMQLAMLFDQPSTRTRVAFETAMSQLGGSALFLTAEEAASESPEDMARTVSRLADVVAIRTADHEVARRFAQHSTVPVINALTDRYHPLQLLADMQTFVEQRGSIAGRKVAFVGDGASRMAQTYVRGSELLGFHLQVATPSSRQPTVVFPSDLVHVHQDAEAAVRNADLVVTDRWVAEQAADREALAAFQVTPALMDLASPRALFMHSLPANRGQEISADMLEDHRSVVWDVAENRLHTAKAVLEQMLLPRVSDAVGTGADVLDPVKPAYMPTFVGDQTIVKPHYYE
jgi:ornithine carbamoyltransferase